MICITCKHDSKKKDRLNGQCPKCKKPFAFEPQNSDPVTDMLFKNAIDAVSGGGRIRWGVEHLHYEVCRRKSGPRTLRGALVGAFAVGIVTLAVTKMLMVALLGAVIFWFAWRRGLARYFIKQVPITATAFGALWNRWCKVHGTPLGVIQRAPQPAQVREPEPDLADYSFDRAVVCDRARTVDLLVANNFHFENNCAVLSIDGYPKGPFETIRTMLKRNPRLQVFALHDATVNGCSLAQRIASERAWFDGKIRIIDLGLRPRHARRYRGLWLAASETANSSSIGIAPGIDADEAKWLAANSLELAAVRPEEVLKRLFHGLQSHANDSPDGGGVTSCGSFDSGSDAADGGSVDGADGFG